MRRSTLRKILNLIRTDYKLTPFGEEHFGMDHDDAEDFVKCLHNPNLAQHLLDTELVPCESDLKEMMPDFKDDGSIISSYIEGLDLLISDFGVFERLDHDESWEDKLEMLSELSMK